MLASPEEYIIVEGQKSDSMYFVVHGCCKVQIQTIEQLEPVTMKKKLIRSDHFGEVGFLFNCNRTASVFSTKYNVLARLAKAKMRMLTSDYPIFRDILLQHVMSVKDPYKAFMKKVFNLIPHLQEMDIYVFHKLIYGLRQKIVESNEMVFKVGDPTSLIVIVMRGELEVFCNVDNTTIIIERLGQGTIINSRNFFFENEICKVDIKCSKRATLLLLSKV